MMAMLLSCGMGPSRKGTDLLIKAASYINLLLDLKQFYPELKEKKQDCIILGIYMYILQD